MKPNIKTASKIALRAFLFLPIMLIVITGQSFAQQQSVLVPSTKVAADNFTSFTLQKTYTNLNKLIASTPLQYRSNPDFGKSFIDKDLPGSTQWYERIDKRTLKSRTYINANNPGKIAVQYGYDNLNYVDKNGWLRAIGTKLKPVAHGWSAEQQETPSYLYKDASTALSLGHGQLIVFNKNNRFSGKRISTGRYTVGDNGMLLKDAAANTDKIIRFGRNTIETDYRIKKPLNLNGDLVISEDVSLPEGYTLSENKNYNTDADLPGSLIVTGPGGKIAAEFKTPLCYDNAHNSIAASYNVLRQQDEYKLEIIIPYEWLNNISRQYPVTIDPTVTGTTASWTGGTINSCLNSFGDDTGSIAVTVPAGVTVTNFFVQGSYFAPAMPADSGKMYFWTPCGDSIWTTAGGPLKNIPGIDALSFTDFFAVSPKFASCYAPSCSAQTIRLTLALKRSTEGSGCNSTYLYYDPAHDDGYPFAAYVIGDQIDTPKTGAWSITNSPLCGDSCTLSVHVSAINGVPPYTFVHPFLSNPINFGSYSLATGISSGDTIIRLTLPNCPQTACSSTPVTVPPPTITDVCGNSVPGITSKVLTVNPVPNVIITSTQDTFCLGSKVVVSLESCVAGATFAWTGSDGASGTDTIKDLPSKAGLIIYTVVSTSPAGCTSDVSLVPVIVGAPFNSDFSVDSAVCVGATITATYTGKAPAGSTFTWASPGGTPPSDVNTTGSYSVSYSSAGIDTVTLFVTNGNCISLSEKIAVTATVGTQLTVSANPITICNGQSSKLTANNATAYTWSPSTGLNQTTGSSVMASPTVTTTYTVSGTATCNSSDIVVVNVKPGGPLNVQPQGITVCSGEEVTLYISGSGSNFEWSPATGLNTTTGDSVHATPLQTVTYTVTGSDSNGCISTGTDVLTIAVAPNKPVITISVTGDTLFSNAKNGNQWYFNDTIIKGATDSFLIITGRQKGWYYVNVINAANGCATASDSTTGIYQLPVINNQLSIYPNPANSSINVNVSLAVAEVKDWNLQLTNVLGQTLYTKQSLDYKNEIDLSNLPDGVYFITIINKTAKAVFPILKQ